MATTTFSHNGAVTDNATLNAIITAFSTAFGSMTDLTRVTGLTNLGVAGGAVIDLTNKTGTSVTTVTGATKAFSGTFGGGGLSQSDVGRIIQVTGSGVGGALYSGVIETVTSSTAGTVVTAFGTAVAGSATATIGVITLGSSDVGYEVYRFNDTLQSSTPIFIKIIYGLTSAVSVGCLLTLKMQVSKAVATNGVPYDTQSAQVQITYTSATAENALKTSYLSVGAGRFGLYTQIDSTAANLRSIFTVSRFVDNSGAQISKGVNVCYANLIGVGQQFLPQKGAPFPIGAFTAQLMAAVPNTSGTAAFDGDTGIFHVHPYVGRGDNIVMDLAVGKTADFTHASFPSFTVFGATRTYLAVAIGTTYVGVVGTILLARYD